jgi:DNA end-binding protein Ku
MAKKSSKKTTSKKSKSTSHHERGLWNGSISFGLVNIPVKVVSSKEKEEIHFSMVDPSDLSKVGYKYYNKKTGEEISRSATVKAFEYKKGSYVVMNDADFKKANPKATQTIDIENFVELEEIDPVFFERAYYLLPSKGGEKGYQLITQALAKKKKVAIAKIVLHTKQHLVALIPRGDFLIMETLHFAEEVKDVRELADKKADLPVSKNISKEIAMAEQLIESMSDKWNPEDYEDTYRDDIMKLVNAKVKAGKGAEIEEPEADQGDDEDTGNVTDLMPLLRKSLESKKAGATKHRRAAH